MTWSLEPLDPASHRDGVLTVFHASEDFALLSEGRPAGPETVDDFFAAKPPNREASDSLELGVRAQDGRLIGLLDVARGFPDSAPGI